MVRLRLAPLPFKVLYIATLPALKTTSLVKETALLKLRALVQEISTPIAMPPLPVITKKEAKGFAAPTALANVTP